MVNNTLGCAIFWKHPNCGASFAGICQPVIVSKPTKYQFRKLVQDTQEQILLLQEGSGRSIRWRGTQLQDGCRFFLTRNFLFAAESSPALEPNHGSGASVVLKRKAKTSRQIHPPSAEVKNARIYTSIVHRYISMACCLMKHKVMLKCTLPIVWHTFD